MLLSPSPVLPIPYLRAFPPTFNSASLPILSHILRFYFCFALSLPYITPSISLYLLSSSLCFSSLPLFHLFLSHYLNISPDLGFSLSRSKLAQDRQTPCHFVLHTVTFIRESLNKTNRLFRRVQGVISTCFASFSTTKQLTQSCVPLPSTF